jgi:hypothetical protein
MNKNCEKFTDSIIKAAYHEASLLEKIIVRFHLRKCNDCKNLFREHKLTAKALHRLPEPECPDIVLKQVLSAIGENKFEKPSFIFDFYSIFTRVSFGKIAGGLVIVVVIIVFALFYRNNYKNVESGKYSEAQIEKANIQAQQALVLIGNVFNSTQAKLEDKILPEKVARPINKSFYVINDLFKSGDKNESH